MGQGDQTSGEGDVVYATQEERVGNIRTMDRAAGERYHHTTFGKSAVTHIDVGISRYVLVQRVEPRVNDVEHFVVQIWSIEMEDRCRLIDEAEALHPGDARVRAVRRLFN